MTVLSIPEKVKKTVSDKPQYDQQYCSTHDQKYGDHLHKCPICVGEEILIDMNIIEDACKHTPDEVKSLLEKIIKKWGDTWGEYFTKHANSCLQ